MQTPVVTMKISPREMLLLDVALLVFSNVVAALGESDFQTIEGFGLESVVSVVKRFALDTAEGQHRPLIHRANTLRKSMDMS